MIFPISQHLPTTPRASGLPVGLAQLAQAGECAKDRQCDSWQFALGIESLLAAGISESELRWLTSKGYVQHACEITSARDRVRKFRPGRNLAFAAKTCFVLTEAGAGYAAEVLGEPAVIALPFALRREELPAQVAQTPLVPQWDDQRRVLSLGQCMVKRYKFRSPNQGAILAAFQEEGWPHRIDDPLSPQPEQDPKCRLHDTIKRLNRHQQQRLLHFFGDGTGEGVCWELVAAAALPLPCAARKKKLRRATTLSLPAAAQRKKLRRAA